MINKTHFKRFSATKGAGVMVLFVFISLFLVGTVAAADWDNILEYSNKDLKVTISNSFLLLFKTSEIGAIELKSHPFVNYIKKVGAGSQVVMWYDFNFLGLYENGLGKVKFIDMKTEKEIDRDYSFVYWGNENYEIPIYSEILLGNGTLIYEQTGTETKTRETWLPYNSKDIPKGNIRIGLMTYVEVEDKVDGMWTITGKEVKKHAGWSAALDVSLLSYWRFENNVTDELNANNGVDSGTADIAGIIGRGRDFEQTEGDYVNVGNSTIDLTNGNFTFNMWVKPETLVASARLFAATTTNGYGIYIDTGRLAFSKFGVDGVIGTDAMSVGVWSMLTVIYDTSANLITYYINGTADSGGADSYSSTFSSGMNYYIGNGYVVGTTTAWDGIIDEVSVWTRCLLSTEVTQLYNGGLGITYAVGDELGITLISPEDNANLTTNIIDFSANVSDPGVLGIQNVTIEVWNSTHLVFNETNSSGFEGFYNFSTTLNEGEYGWNVTAYDDADAIYSSLTRSFGIDTTDPAISIIYPNETITFHQLNTNLSLNWSINDTNLDSCWFNWKVTNTTVTCNDNSTTFNITDRTIKTLTFYANDTFGHEANQTVTWNYRLFLNYEIYDASILESLSTTFLANFQTNGSTITLANLSYNSSENTGTINNHGGNNFTVTKTITVPPVSEDTNRSFYWNITQGTLNYALDTKNQTVLNFEIDDCTINGEVLYNFTIVDERTQKKLTPVGNNTDAKVDMEIRGFGTTTLIEQFNKSYSKINPFAVCFNSTDGLFNIDVQIQYDANGYEVEFYHIQNATINSANFPTNITLFDLNSTDSQLFKLIIKDSSFLAIKDALVEVHRKYIDEGVFKIVEIPRTDARGETAAHLVIQDAIYKFIIKKYGVTIATFENVIAVCQTPLVAPCIIDFNAFAETVTVPDFEEAEDFLFTLGFNSSSRIISSIFSIPSGTPSVVAIEVIKEDALGTSVCTDTLTSSSGTLNCAVGGSIGNSTVLAKIYKDGNLQAQGQVKLDQSPSDIYGGVLVIIALLIMMTLIGAGISDNPVYTVLFLMVGVILLFALNLVASNGFIGAGATILWLIIAIILILIKGGRRS